MSIHVRNWEKHQHRDFAKRKSQSWLRLDAAIFDDPKIADLTAAQFRAWIKMLTLAARTGNQIPDSPGYLRAHLGTLWREFCASFVALSLIDAPELAAKPPQKRTTGRASAATSVRIQETRTHEEQLGPPTAVVGRGEEPIRPAPLGDLVDEIAERRQRKGMTVNGQQVTADQLLNRVTRGP